jgi:hypothetical protein
MWTFLCRKNKPIFICLNFLHKFITTRHAPNANCLGLGLG